MVRVTRVAFVLFLAAGHGFAQSFNLDVGPLGTQPPPTYAAAGLAGVWNSVRADHVTPFTPGPHALDVMLVDVHGNQTSVGFHQYGGMDLVSTNDPSVTGDDAVLLNDYLATHSTVLESCMYLNGLASGIYESIVYAWMPNSPATDQLVRYDDHPGTTLVGGTWPGSHVQGVTYAHDVFEVTSGNIGLHVGIPGGGATFPGAAFNGWQVRKIEPATVPTFTPLSLGALASAVALAGTLLLRRRAA